MSTSSRRDEIRPAVPFPRKIGLAEIENVEPLRGNPAFIKYTLLPATAGFVRGTIDVDSSSFSPEARDNFVRAIPVEIGAADCMPLRQTLVENSPFPQR